MRMQIKLMKNYIHTPVSVNEDNEQQSRDTWNF